MSYTPKGLATVALLKTRLDAGYDHLGLFEPLILDALLHLPEGDFLAGDVKATLHERTGLLMPVDALQTLLARCARRDFLSRRGGRYFRTSKPIPDPRLDEARGQHQSEQAALGQALANYSKESGVEFPSDEGALTALATFVSDNKVNLVLDEVFPDSPLDRSSLERKPTRVIARFITERCLQSAELRPALEALTEGIVLQDTLLLRDLPAAAQLFQDLVVCFDTGLLFAAMDLMGAANGVAAKEGLSLLREAGARTIAFTRTVAEMRNILSLYEHRLATTAGRLSLYSTPLTHHILTNRLSSADMRIISATLETRLASLGITIRDLPKHDPRFTLDEKTLAAVLIDPKHPDPEAPRIQHDVDCVAAVLTLRGGRRASSVERSIAIFSSVAGRVIRNIQMWFADQQELGVPPIVHQAALTSIAWLKKPAAAPNVKMAELAATCVAAMRPTRETWKKLTDTLRRLRAEGTITDDETAAIVASELTEPLLARLDDDLDPDSDSIEEAILRVRESYQRDASRAAEEAVANAHADAALAQRSASTAIARRDHVVSAVEARSRLLARRVVKPFFLIAVLIVIAAGVLSLPGVFDGVSGATRWVARLSLLAATVFGIYSAIHGHSLASLRGLCEEALASRIASRWLPSEAVAEEDASTTGVGGGSSAAPGTDTPPDPAATLNDGKSDTAPGGPAAS